MWGWGLVNLVFKERTISPEIQSRNTYHFTLTSTLHNSETLSGARVDWIVDISTSLHMRTCGRGKLSRKDNTTPRDRGQISRRLKSHKDRWVGKFWEYNQSLSWNFGNIFRYVQVSLCKVFMDKWISDFWPYDSDQNNWGVRISLSFVISNNFDSHLNIFTLKYRTSLQ